MRIEELLSQFDPRRPGNFYFVMPADGLTKDEATDFNVYCPSSDSYNSQIPFDWVDWVLRGHVVLKPKGQENDLLIPFAMLAERHDKEDLLEALRKSTRRHELELLVRAQILGNRAGHARGCKPAEQPVDLNSAHYGHYPIKDVQGERLD